jgi:AcrR family transcriptional regulator
VATLSADSPAQTRILDAATDAFAELGFGGTSTRDIAKRAGRSPSVVYVHHASKEALLFAISVRGHEAALACLRTAARSQVGPTEQLRAMVEALCRWHMDHAPLGRVVHHEFHALTPAHRRTVTALRREFVATVVAVLEEGAAGGVFELEDPRPVANALLSLAVDVSRWFDPQRPGDRKARARQYADLAVRMVRPGCPHPAGTGAP